MPYTFIKNQKNALQKNERKTGKHMKKIIIGALILVAALTAVTAKPKRSAKAKECKITAAKMARLLST